MLQIAEGWTVNLPDEVYRYPVEAHRLHMALHMVCSARYRQRARLQAAYDVMNNWGANHGAISYGHIGADLITMCSMLRIPVACTTCPRIRSSVPHAGTHSEWIRKVRTSVHARHTAHSIRNNRNIKRLRQTNRLPKPFSLRAL